MKKIEILLLCFLAIFSFMACTDEFEDVDDTRIPVGNTTIMFFPWSNNLKPCFIQNINDFKHVIQQHGSDNERYVVCIETAPESVDLIELKNQNGTCTEEILETYSNPKFTTSEGITDMLDRVYAKFPSNSYSMTVGCHGTAWAPIDAFATRSSSASSDEMPLTRYLGGTTPEYQIEISTFKQGIKNSKINRMEMILFDNCYMANIEVAYELKDVCKYIIAYPTEVMAYGFPYLNCGKYLINGVDYEAVCDEFYRFYIGYEKPCGTISTINCNALDSLARLMKKINLSVDTTVKVNGYSLQRLDGYSPRVFFDFQDYVYHLTEDENLLQEFDHVMSVAVPYKRNTPSYFSTLGGQIAIKKYCGVSTSEPTEHPIAEDYKKTSWYLDTH